jgi:hypothetical protein
MMRRRSVAVAWRREAGWGLGSGARRGGSGGLAGRKVLMLGGLVGVDRDG